MPSFPTVKGFRSGGSSLENSMHQVCFERLLYVGSRQDAHFKDRPNGWQVVFQAADGKHYAATQTYFVTEECWRGIEQYFCQAAARLDGYRLRGGPGRGGCHAFHQNARLRQRLRLRRLLPPAAAARPRRPGPRHQRPPLRRRRRRPHPHLARPNAPTPGCACSTPTAARPRCAATASAASPSTSTTTASPSSRASPSRPAAASSPSTSTSATARSSASPWTWGRRSSTPTRSRPRCQGRASSTVRTRRPARVGFGRTCGFDPRVTCVSMGNPHAVFYCDDVSKVPLESGRPGDRKRPGLPAPHQRPFRAGAFARRGHDADLGARQRRDPGVRHRRLRRGRGRRADRPHARRVVAHLPGGDLELHWSEADDHVYMTGPAVEVFSGEWPGRR